MLFLLLTSAFLLVSWAEAGEYRETGLRGRHARAEMGTKLEFCLVLALTFLIFLLSCSSSISQLRLCLKPIVHYRY